MKYVSIDIETTGLNPERDDLIEFGAVVDDLSNPDVPIEDLPTFHCYNILDFYQGSAYALSMHPIIFRRIAEKDPAYHYCYNGKIAKVFYDFLDKQDLYKDDQNRLHVNCAGKNFASFDLQFINNKTDINKGKIKLRHRAIDPSVMFMFVDDESVPGTEECLRRAGLPINMTHTAVEDARDVIRLIRKAFHRGDI